MESDIPRKKSFRGLFGNRDGTRDPDKRKASENAAEEKIKNVIDEAHEKGALQKEEADMMANVMSFAETDAADVMIHRNDVMALKDDVTISEAADIMVNGPYSRYPVYNDDLDNILGIIYLKDTVKYMMEHRDRADRPIGETYCLLRKPAFIQETRSIDDIFKFMRQNKTHMVIVVDEYGQTSGIVTMEDIIEEIFGNIEDEYDVDEKYIQKGYNCVIMDGMTPLDEVEEVLDHKVGEDNDYETLNGYLTALLDHVPTDADKEVRDESFIYRILSVKNNIIQKVRAERIKER